MVLNVYKEKGWTSFDVVAKLRGVLGLKKVGHAGTLDPLAEGVLLVLTGKDRKKQEELMKLPKEYRCEIAFGAITATYDLEEDLQVSKKVPDLGELKRRVEKILPNYLGRISQTAPPYSAKKVRGKRLYKIAREGKVKEAELPRKKVEIHDFEILGFSEKEFAVSDDRPKKKISLPVVKCLIKCSSGTYIRSIAHDLGEDLGYGGVLTNLVRTKVGEYTVEKSKRVSQIEDMVKNGQSLL
jgi:tRNA pseudouridine55 synthase